MNKTIDVRKITLIGIGMAINIIGAFIAVQFKLPIYMDSIGTVLIACLLGPKYAVITGLGGSLISGMTFDIYSIYFAPVQITTGYIAGIMYNKKMMTGKKLPLGVLAFSLPTSIVSAIIAAAVFGGVTSAGSSYIVQILEQLGVPMVTSVFLVQVLTDYMDEYVAVMLVMAGLSMLPGYLKNRYRQDT